jgi:hypothetical protein
MMFLTWANMPVIASFTPLPGFEKMVAPRNFFEKSKN